MFIVRVPALALTFALVLFWSVVGLGTLTVLRRRASPLQNLLLAPGVGSAIVAVTALGLSSLGWPVRLFAAPLVIGLLLVSSGALLWRRPILPWRQYAPFVGILVLGLLVTGRPLVEYGYDWLSYANDDMVTYVTGAEWFLARGFGAPVDPVALSRDRVVAFSWVWYEVLRERVGCELLLAVVGSISGLRPHRVYMAVMFALYVTLISAAAAMVLAAARRLRAAMVTCVLVAFSALTTLGVLYQLIAQVWGVGLLCSAGALCLRRIPRGGSTQILPRALAAAVPVAGILAVYPEVLGFLGLAVALYTAARIRWEAGALRRLVTFWGMVAIAVALLVGYRLPAILRLLTHRAMVLAPGAEQRSLFPYFLLPTGLANFWGMLPLGSYGTEPWVSFAIALGAGLMLIAAATVAWKAFRGEPIAALAAALLAAWTWAFAARLEFPLYKLAMYAQAPVLATLAVAWLDVGGRRSRAGWRAAAPLLALAVLSLPAQWYYVEQSRGGTRHSGFVEIPGASAAKVVSEMEAVARQTTGPLLVDTHNTVIARMLTLLTPGRPVDAPGLDEWPRVRVGTAGTMFRSAWFDFDGPGNSNGPTSEFRVYRHTEPSAIDVSHMTLIAARATQNLLNRRRLPAVDGSAFAVRPIDTVRDHLVFVPSELGQSYYSDRRNVALYQLESDPMLRGRTMVGVGRYLIFRVLNPTPAARLVVELSTTFKADGEARLPPAAVVGKDRLPLPFVGRGSARVVSAPLEPQSIDGYPYVGIDMGVDGTRFPDRRRGLSRLYRLDITIDPRQLVGFARDLSIVSAGEYARFTPPASVRTFPGELAHPDLEYSGLYEDGWVAEVSFLILSQPAGRRLMQVRGRIPGLQPFASGNNARLLVDGRELDRKRMLPGDFELAACLPDASGRRRIDLHFDRVARLSSQDPRLAAAHLSFVGFAEQPGCPSTP